MPLFKIPIVHRFGIISHADHLLIEKSIAEETQKLSNTKNAARRNPFEVTEQFIQQFNHAKERKEKEQMIDVARKMLTRNKRKAGLNAMGSGNHVNLPLAWTELAFLVHCKEKIQEGLPEREACYQSFPNILLDVRFIITTGEIICGSVKSNEEYCQRTGNLVEDVNKNVCRLQVRTACRCPRQVAEPQQKVCNISPVLRECLLVWIYVKHKIQHLDDILKHLLLREQLCNTDWIDSALGLLLLGEAAKMNMACLKVLTELGTTLVSRVGSNNIKQLIHLYCCILGDICLYGSTSEIQKAALNGYGNSSKSPNRTNAPGLLQLLQVQPATAPGDDQDSNWWIRYGAAYSLAKFCHILYGDKNQKGLRNAAWDALQKHQSLEQDTQVLGAIKVAEAELNGPINPFISGSSKTSPSLRNSVAVHFLGWRIASVLSQLCLPPVVPYTVFPRMLPQRPIRSRSPLPKQVNIEKKVARLSLRQEITLAQDHELLPDFNTRTNFNLRRIVEDQWRKELQAEMKKKEKERELQLHEKQKIETEDFSEMIKRKEEKLHKKSILSEIPS
ncbi:transmembrane protein 232 isoform X2 [Chiloscyllium plagiosum]|uniref:transmembrane protein 232 isoform X2 n=1 Tax=Chiloscyllium plagiosum TaxID=36176 RepID=UPI001CB8452B|nr:transmembrane protein 232 isoform X2 [Chiloscyllium plagiosum]